MRSPSPSHSMMRGIQRSPQYSGSQSSMAAPFSQSPFEGSLTTSNSSSSGPSTPLTSPSSEILENNSFNLSVPNDKFIAIVGGLGYIGSHTSLELLKVGYNIVIIDNLSNSYSSVFHRIEALARNYCERECRPMPNLRFEEADYRDESSMRRILDQYVVENAESSSRSSRPSTTSRRTSRIEGVIHFAGYKSVQESIEEPLKYYNNNVAGLINFCTVLGCYNIKTFIFSSSATVYGSIANDGAPLREEYCVHQPEEFISPDGQFETALPGCTGLTNPYGRTKWMCEAILADLAFADPEWTVLALRYFNPVGCDESGLLREDPRGVPTNLMPVVVNVITGLSPVLDVYGADYSTMDGSAVRDYIHVTDLARGHLAALRAAAGMMGFRTYNIGSGTGYSVFEVVAAMETAFSTKIPINITERRSGDVGVCVATPRRAEVELNWKTERDIQECCWDICNSIKLFNAIGHDDKT